MPSSLTPLLTSNIHNTSCDKFRTRTKTEKERKKKTEGRKNRMLSTMPRTLHCTGTVQ